MRSRCVQVATIDDRGSRRAGAGGRLAKWARGDAVARSVPASPGASGSKGRLVDAGASEGRTERTLILIRHAHAGHAGGHQRDHERKLDATGRREALAMGRRWALRGDAPDVLLCSTASRAHLTARLLAKRIGFPEARIEARADLYGAGVEQLLTVLEETDPAARHVAIVCHNPGVSSFTRWLCAEFHGGMRTCAMARIALDAESWFDLAQHRGRLVDFDEPGRAAAGPKI